MTTRLRSWWQKIRKPLAVIAAIALLAGVLVLLILTGYRFTWTGFSNKTLWDWLNLLGVLAIPAVVGLGAAWFTAQQGKVSDRENTDNQRETVLQTYIDKMSELLLKEHLGELTPEGKLKPEYEGVRNIARVRTLTALRRLDAERKGSVLRFLQESGLIDNDNKVINLDDANLFRANLQWADLSRAGLSGADLWQANLYHANLSKASLNLAVLNEANLCGADLSSAFLSATYLNGADLSGADLSGALQPHFLITAI
jgi:hypothetical protein